MSLKVDEMDMDNLSEDEKTYLRQRPWLPQPPGDPKPERAASDWNEDETEVVAVQDDEDEDEFIRDAVGGIVDEDGDPINVDENGLFVSYAWPRFTNVRLREFLVAYNLPVGGTKPTLVARLEEYTELNKEA